MTAGSATPVPEFDKYEDFGAYHWGKLEPQSLRARHSRLWGRYEWFLRGIPADARRVIDVGCGDAALTHLLTTVTDAEVIGVEPEPAGVEQAVERLAAVGSGARIVQGSGEDLPVEDASADVVTLCEVIEHVQDGAALMREAARVLRPDGIVLISTPRRQDQPTDPWAVHEYSPEELTALCKRFFESAEAQIAEPVPLLRLWGSRPGRIAVNALARVSANPFHIRAPASSRRRQSWRQLYAVARRPQT